MKLGIDPGMTTGVVVIDDIKSADDFQVIGLGEVTWSNRFWFKKFFSIHYDHIDHIVVESFNLHKHKAQAQTGSIMPSARMIGIVEAFAFEYGLIDKITFQTSAEIKQYGHYTIHILDQHVKHFKGFKREHTRDAYRHLRVFLKEQVKK